MGIQEKFTIDARKPLKQWYNTFYNQWLESFNQPLLNSKNVGNLKVSTETLKNVSLVIEDKPINLNQLVVDAFRHVKKRAMSSKNSQLISYYSCFFNTFSKKTIESSCCIQHGSIGLQSLKLFNNVSNLEEFKNYLSSIPGLYPKIILWAIDNPFPIQTQQSQHHAMPKFLINHYGFSSLKILKSYNIVKTSWIVHFLMHLIRLVEYGQPLDEKALDTFTFLKTLETKTTNPTVIWNPYHSLAQCFTVLAKKNFLQAFPEFETLRLQSRNKGLQKAARSRICCSTKQILSKDTLWRTCNGYKKLQPPELFQFTHPGQKPENYGYETLLNLLIQSYNQQQQYLNSPKRLTEKDKDSIRNRLHHYFNGQCREKSIHGFYMVNAKPPVIPYETTK